MSYEVNFANTKLQNYFEILKIKRTILPPRTNFTKEIPNIHGQLYTGFKYGPKKYTLTCFLDAVDNLDLQDKVRHIAFILDTKGPSKLILGDEPSVYNYAVVDGGLDLNKIGMCGTFEIDFICYDPISYSIDEKEISANSKNAILVENGGTTDVYPKVSIEFTKDAHFLQCTNYDGKTILVGTPPSIDKPKVNASPIVLNDNCETLTNWISTGNVLDVDREIVGNLTINQGGYGICLGNAGSGSSWHGGALRRNLNQNLTEFRVEVKMEHNSKGDVKGTGSTPTIPPVTNSEYVITADPTLRVRSGRGTSYSQIGSYKKGTTVTVIDIASNWGKVLYEGKDGYISMDYAQKKVASVPTTSLTYKVNASSGLNLRSGRGTKYSRLIVIPNGTQLSVTDISAGWGKVTYSGKTGYVSMQYMSKVNTSMAMAIEYSEIPRENLIGVVEVYGYDLNGTKLFKTTLKDAEEFYEYTEPFVEFGSSVTLDDSKKCPAPKTVTVKDDEGKVVMKDGAEETNTINSGKFGDWNEFVGWFTIERKIKNGKQYWYAKVEKVEDGRVVRKIETQTLSGNYPTGALNNVVIFIGGHSDKQVVDVMNVSEIKVTNLTNPPQPGQISPIFSKGDDLVIDNLNQKIYKNGKLFMTQLDIGSQFFSNPVGTSEFACKSDDTYINVLGTIQKRWL